MASVIHRVLIDMQKQTLHASRQCLLNSRLPLHNLQSSYHPSVSTGFSPLNCVLLLTSSPIYAGYLCATYEVAVPNEHNGTEILSHESRLKAWGACN